MCECIWDTCMYYTTWGAITIVGTACGECFSPEMKINSVKSVM